MKRVPRWMLFPIALACLAASGSHAHAQAAAHADTLFNEGKAKLAEQNYAEACPLFAGSFAMDPATGTLLALALCHERAGEVKTAIKEYRDAAGRAEKEGRADRARAASKRADELEAKLEPEPAIVPPPVAKKERKAAPIKPLPPEPEPRASGGLTTWQWVGIATASAGVLTLGASAGFAVHAAGLNDDSKPACDGDLCTAEGRATRLDAVSAGNVASAMALTGAVLVATGAAIFFSTGSDSSSDELALSPWVTESSAGAAASGRF